MVHVTLKMSAKREEVHLQVLVQKDTAFVALVSMIRQNTYMYSKNYTPLRTAL